MKEISKMNDREILELILTNQISLAQQIHRIREVVAKQFVKDYAGTYKSKLDIFEELLENSDDFLREFESKD
ncbi:hypothetical protein [Flavobacterium soyangense]|uniref:Uncharacterized protein n=1 Tax=Flavobacterium soyangense TaxID=2023265 RepID=A0A930Y214_9FLAO|nr:hypothetical protein [Flavobacterium soyangense]MBF2710044.1 hypothetical protein [Flavobacterium soyangense]